MNIHYFDKILLRMKKIVLIKYKQTIIYISRILSQKLSINLIVVQLANYFFIFQYLSSLLFYGLI